MKVYKREEIREDPSTLFLVGKILLNLWNIKKFWKIYVNHKRDNKKPEILRAMSDVANYLDIDLKQALTIQEEGNVYTPQMSFIEVFKDYDVYFIDVGIFKYKFIEFYSRKGEAIANEFLKNPVINKTTIYEFWRKFDGIFNIREYANTKTVNAFKAIKNDAAAALFFQKIRRLLRVLFSSIGIY